MRQPRVAAAALVAVVLAVAIGIGLAARSDEGGGDARAGVQWSGKPEVIPARNLPNDGIVTGKIRNDTLRRLELDAENLVVVDDRGRRWRTSGRFMQGFAHGLWPPGDQVEISASERERLGELARLEPGEAAPLTVAWSRPPGAGRPVRLELGGPTLPIPAERPNL